MGIIRVLRDERRTDAKEQVSSTGALDASLFYYKLLEGDFEQTSPSQLFNT